MRGHSWPDPTKPQSKDDDTKFNHVINILSMTDSERVSSFLMAHHHIKGNFSAIKWHGE